MVLLKKAESASGVAGLDQIRIGRGNDRDYRGVYAVRVYFAEPEQREPGVRMLDCAGGGVQKEGGKSGKGKNMRILLTGLAEYCRMPALRQGKKAF